MQDVSTFISSLEENKILFNKDEDKEVYRSIEDKINLRNVTVLYQISQLFKFSNIRKSPILFIERFFPTICEYQQFLDLDYRCVVKILSSSYLKIDSELEVFNAIVSWLGKSKERNTFAKHLFLKVRLSLLSVPALQFISGTISSFIDIAFINKIVNEKSKGFQRRNLKTNSRYCNQDKFDIIVCGGSKHCRKTKAFRDVYCIKSNNHNDVTSLP